MRCAIWNAGHSFLIDGLSTIFTEQLNMVKPNGVVIAISHSPYVQEVVEWGAKRGTQQIAITDTSKLVR